MARGGRGGPLLERATRVPVTSGWLTNELTYSGYRYFYYHVPGYYWLSDSRILSIRELERGRYETDWVDLREQSVRREPGLGPLCRDAAEAAGVFYWSISPDGRWGVTVRVEGERLVHRAVRVVGPPGNRVWASPQEVHVDLCWVSDSSGFVEWPSRPEGTFARFHWLATGGVDEVRLAELPVRTMTGRERLAGPFVVVSPRIELESDDIQLLVRESGETGRTAAWSRYSIETPRRLRDREFKVVPSPGGDRLAWIVFFRRWLPELSSARTFPFVSTQTRYSTVLFVSGLDGRGLQAIGDLPPGEEINRVAWLPGRRALSFVIRDGLWTVAVPD